MIVLTALCFLSEAVAGDDFFVEVGGHLGSALLSLEVDVVDAEAVGIAVGPFVVVHEAPAEVALDGNALADSAVELSEVVAEVHDAVGS